MARRALPLFLGGLVACGGSGGGAPTPTPTPSSSYAQKMLGGLESSMIEKTRGDMQAVATAINSYIVESGSVAPGTTYATLGGWISPAYIRRMPVADGWGYPFTFEAHDGGWSLTAPGPDGAVGTADDLVLSDGGWTKLPEGYRPGVVSQ